MKPVHIFINRRELTGYTSLTLSRSKKDLTGQASVGIFMGWLPDSPVLGEVVTGLEITIYIAGNLVFTGTVDRRKDDSSRKPSSSSSGKGKTGGSFQLSVGDNDYSLTLECRGKTKSLVDSSHQLTSTMVSPTNKEFVEKLVEPWGIELEWLAAETALNRVRIRDGARVVDELARMGARSGFFAYETRDGKLRVTDEPPTDTGEDLVLGTNILGFSTDLRIDQTKTEVLVKGQRNENDTWGEDAVVNTMKRITDSTVDGFIPLNIQMYGNGTDELLQRRAQFEQNKRNADAKEITLDVFHVQQSDGRPWDLGMQHYIEIPPAGIFNTFELTKINYTVQPNSTLKTSLTFSPLPAGSDSGAIGSSGTPFAGLPTAVGGLVNIGASRAARYGASALLAAWNAPILAVAADAIEDAVEDTLTSILSDVEVGNAKPPLTLPAGFKGADE